MSESTVGITAYAAYIPATRLPLALIHGARAKEGGAEKAVAAFDEDSITMAVSAGVNCLQEVERKEVDGLYLATTTSPFREKQAAAFVAKALDLREDIATVDFSGSLRAAAGALQAAINAVKADPGKQILVVASDSRLPAPRSALEMNTGDGAAAFLIGSENVQAEILAASSIADEIYDVWRTEHDDYLRSWEDRFNVMHGYRDNVIAACQKLFEASGTQAGDYSSAVLYAQDARSVKDVARRLCIEPGALQDGFFGRMGSCGAAYTPVLLAAALEGAKRGERLLVAFYGDGAEVFSLQIQSADFKPQRTVSSQLATRRSLRSYESYLKGRHLDVGEHDRRGGEGVPATVHFRERDDDISFHGQRCRQCGTVHFPACRVCYTCNTKDDFEAVRLSDLAGRVLSYSFDYFFPSPEPPLIVGMCEVENGARVYVQMCEAETAELCCDLPVEFVFRKIHDAGNRPNYFWKSRPLRSDEQQEGTA